jgi:hypothetical protein
MAKEKVYVPVVEPKSTSYVEYIELGRTVTSCSVFKKDTIRVRLLQRNLGNPAETFETEKNWEYDIPWSEKKEEEKVRTKPLRARNEQGQFIANDPNTSENEAWVGGKAPSVPKIKRKRKTKSKIQNALTNLLKND